MFNVIDPLSHLYLQEKKSDTDPDSFGDPATAETFNMYGDAIAACGPLASVVAVQNLKTYILAGLDHGDCYTVFCHWHYKPSDEEISSMLTSVEDKSSYVHFCMLTEDRIIKASLPM